MRKTRDLNHATLPWTRGRRCKMSTVLRVFLLTLSMPLVSCQTASPGLAHPRARSLPDVTAASSSVAPPPRGSVSSEHDSLERDISEPEALSRAREYLLSAAGSEELPRELWFASCGSRCRRIPTADASNRPLDACALWECLAFYYDGKAYGPGSVNFTLLISARSIKDSLNGIERCFSKSHHCRLNVSEERARKAAGVTDKTWTAALTWDETAGEFIWLFERLPSQSSTHGALPEQLRVSAHSVR